MKQQEEMMLSEHFSLGEMVRSGVAIRKNIDNQPTADDIRRMQLLCQNVLEPLRRQFGVIRITSGYRCPALNRQVGGAPTSQHLLGEAADIHLSSREAGARMYHYIYQHLPFDQLLLERQLSNGCCWLHVSYTERRPNRRQAISCYTVA
ncbi:MAG: DUF882 domain-containing protein [Prevotella sp.]|nr:DUF882 domain-containing protein [Prevotella sp.]